MEDVGETENQQVDKEEDITERITKKRPLEGGSDEVVVDDTRNKRTKPLGNESTTAASSPTTMTSTPDRVEKSSPSSLSQNEVEVWLRGVPVDATSDEVKEALGCNSWVIRFLANQAGDAKLELTGEGNENAVAELLSRSTIIIKGKSVEAYCPGAAPPSEPKVENNEEVPSASWTIDSSIGGEGDLTTVIQSDVGRVDRPAETGGGNGEATTPKVAVLRLRGLPYSSTVDGVKAFFSGLQLAAGSPVHLMQNDHGRLSGEVRRTK